MAKKSLREQQRAYRKPMVSKMTKIVKGLNRAEKETLRKILRGEK